MRAVPGRRGAILAALLLFLAPIASARVALVGGTVIDGFRRVPLDDAVVLVDGDRIAAVGPRSETPIPPDTEIVETTGKYLVPGLIDASAVAEVRYAGFGGLLSFDVADADAARAVETGTKLIANMTSLGGVASRIEARARWEGGSGPLPFPARNTV